MRRIYLSFLFLIIAVSMSANAFGQAAAAKLPTVKIKEYSLKNGLRVILHPDDSTPIVAVNVWYHVGSKNETLGRTGFAHLFEHMMFQGSKNYGDGYLGAMDEAGAQVNGTTNEDRTYYYEVVRRIFWSVRCIWKPTEWAACWTPCRRKSWITSGTSSKTNAASGSIISRTVPRAKRSAK